jgi:transketolase
MKPITDENGMPFFGEGYEYRYGLVDIIRSGEDVTLISTGQVTHKAVMAADELKEHGIRAAVLNVSTPINADLEAVKKYLKGNVISLEDHNVNSGLAATLKDYFVRAGFLPERFIPVGVDKYMYSGNNEALYDIVGLSKNSIVKRVRDLI